MRWHCCIFSRHPNTSLPHRPMATILAFLRREARVQRILIVAILFVSSLQFFVHDGPTSQEYADAIHSFHSGPTRKRSVLSPSSDIANVSSVGAAANASHANDNLASSSLILENTKNLVFCGHCSYDLHNTCNERLKFVMGRHHVPEGKAREDLIPDCGIDYSSEPYVLLHAGPHKTGTTSIQSFLYHSLWKNATFLDEDNFAIPTFDELPGRFGEIGPMLNFAHCMIANLVRDGGQMNMAMCNKLRFGTFPHFLEKHHNQSHHVLIVAEDLDRVTIDHKRMLYYLRPYRRLRVVVDYRRQHDWLPSWYNQIVDLYTVKYIRGEARYPSFVEWIDERYNEFRQVHAIEVATRYRNSGKFESVDILNMHDDVSLLEDLFCNYVPFANATCQGIIDGAKSTRPNIGRTHEYERLATKAFLRGKIRNYHTAIAPKVAEQIKNAAVERGIFKDGDAYPKICLNQTFLDQLLQTEMEQERKYFPKWYESQGGDEGLRKEFENAKHKLCSMDDEKVLASGVLDPIFEELNK
mmetsp:Transcript_6000/g.10353  ORF Transcript_6000/g.10353 Transcript_6000/m.10353 type:complete len:525 (+) Transcript_6000:131-1705(+)